MFLCKEREGGQRDETNHPGRRTCAVLAACGSAQRRRIGGHGRRRQLHALPRPQRRDPTTRSRSTTSATCHRSASICSPHSSRRSSRPSPRSTGTRRRWPSSRPSVSSSRPSPTRSTPRRAAAGCDKYNLSGSDEVQFQQMTELAAAEAPGTVGFLTFLDSLSTAATDGIRIASRPTAPAPSRRSSRSWVRARR